MNGHVTGWRGRVRMQMLRDPLPPPLPWWRRLLLAVGELVVRVGYAIIALAGCAVGAPWPGDDAGMDAAAVDVAPPAPTGPPVNGGGAGSPPVQAPARPLPRR